MTTFNPALTRRACDRLTSVRTEEAASLPRPSRYTWLKVALPIPMATDSRRETSMLSTSLSTDLPRVLDVAALVGGAIGLVSLLSLVCR